MGVVPPLVGVAVKVTLVPAQIVVELADITTDGVTAGVTVMVMVLDVSAEGTAHCAFDTIIHLNTSPLLIEEAL